jgi:predicted Rossmann-fold nucleotide-binding protein
MKIFVPRFQWDSAQQDRERLINMFGELIAPNAEQNLERIVREWNEADHQKGYKVIKAMYRRSASKILGPGVVEKHTLEPYLRREHVTAHGGAKPGADHCRDHDRQVAMEIGAGIAELGFNLWYGGGEDGRMGDYLNGFLQQIQRHRYPDQYSVQVSPASFALPKEFKSVNGATAANEGLSPHSDIALVIPKFVNRRDFLDSVCIAAITGVGGVGSCDELLDILVHKKTGQTDTLSYVLNEYRPRAGINF